MSLFAEIAGAPPAAEVAARDAVAAHVQRICSIRRGSLLLAPDYGIDDVTLLFHSFPMIDAWGEALERTLARYEPRLRNVQVLPVVDESSDTTLRAEIRGVLVGGERPAQARFTATIDPQCRLKVR